MTLAVLADFSKAFDTVDYETVLKKLHVLGFSKSFLRWVTDYLTGRKQFVQIDDRISKSADVAFGVPQGSVLGPVRFNPYVNDFIDYLGPVNTIQYADDTTLYISDKPTNINVCVQRLQLALDRLSSWCTECNLALNPVKTKFMLLSTPQLAHVHNPEDHQVNLTANGQMLERVTTTRLLGTELQQNLDWSSDTNTKISSCYATLSVLRKLKNLAPFQVRKQLAESLILSKLDYDDTVTFPIHDYLVKRLQRVQLAAAGFVIGKYANLQDFLKLGWLPIPERQQFHMAKLAFQSVSCSSWPKQLKTHQYVPARDLRSSKEFKLCSNYIMGTFKHSASRVFNSLPNLIRSSETKHQFIASCKSYFMAKASDRVTV